MKALGIVRPIDGLGRVVLPMEIRKTQGWVEGTKMEMFMSEEGLVMREYGNKHEELVDTLKTISSMDWDTDLQVKINSLIDKYSK